MNPINGQDKLRQRQHDAIRRMVLVEKKAIDQGLTPAEVEELSAIEARWREALDARRRPREAEFTHLPSLPPALPEFSGWDGKKESDFCLWCKEGQVEVVRQYLEEQGLNESAMQRGLASAAEGRQVAMARYLLQKGAKLHGHAVESAISSRNLGLLKAYVESGWHPNQQIPCPEGGIGVALPYCTEDLQITQFLLSKGADPNVGRYDIRKRSGFGSRPPLDRQSGQALSAAAGYGNIEVISLLLQHGAKLEWATPLHAAICPPGEGWSRNREAFLHILRLGADPNKDIRFDSGNLWEMGTPLLWASRVCNWDAAEILVKSGADPEYVFRAIRRPYPGMDADLTRNKLTDIIERMRAQEGSLPITDTSTPIIHDI